MYTKQQQLAYLKKIQTLHQFNVLKDDIHLTYKYRNRNKAIDKAHRLQDKIINAIIDEAVYGNTSPVEVTNTVNDLITNTLNTERNRIHHDQSRFVDHAVEAHSQKYSEILNNRINIEAVKLETKIESEIRSGIHEGLSEDQLRKELQSKYGETGKKRIQNIIKDSIHSQECNISFIQAINEDWRYKVWCNGNKRGNTRAWHIAKYISPVPIDEPFIINGPRGKKESMFPGDLNSGPENVANCKCYLRYTNNRPSGLRQTSFNVPSTSYLNRDNTQSFTSRIKQGVQNVSDRVSSAIADTTSNIKTSIKDVSSRIRKRFKF